MGRDDETRIPRWARRDVWETKAAQVAQEYARMSATERFECLRDACALAMSLALTRPDPEQVLSRQEPLPQSSLEHLARLRRASKCHG